MPTETRERRKIIDPQPLIENTAALQTILNSLTQQQLAAVEKFSFLKKTPMPSHFAGILSEHTDASKTAADQLNLDVAQLIEWALKSNPILSKGEIVEIIYLYYTSGHPTDIVLDHNGEVSRDKIDRAVRTVAFQLENLGLLEFDQNWNLVLVENE